MRRIIESAVVVLVLVACDSDFTKGWLVDRTRVLGLRIEAAADPTRATVSPGEKLVARWLVGAPNGSTTFPQEMLVDWVRVSQPVKWR